MENWDSLRYVLAAARELSFNGAARVLGVNHATVSRQIARYEEVTGQELFHRLPNGLALTPAGQSVFAFAKKVEAQMLELDLSLKASQAATDTLRVTIPPLLVDAAFAQDIAEYRRTHPDVALEVLGANRILNLHRREADVAIRVSYDPAESLWGRVIAHQQSAWFASPAFCETYAEALETGGALPFIRFKAWEWANPKDLIDRFPGAYPAVICDDLAAALSFVRAGLATTMMPWGIGNTDPDLVQVMQLPVRDYAPIWALTHPDLRRNPVVRGFLSYIADRFAERPRGYWAPTH